MIDLIGKRCLTQNEDDQPGVSDAGVSVKMALGAA